ncbi:unnamed protein product, partial [Phaeothamnion confervicola]
MSLSNRFKQLSAAAAGSGASAQPSFSLGRAAAPAKPQQNVQYVTAKHQRAQIATEKSRDNRQSLISARRGMPSPAWVAQAPAARPAPRGLTLGKASRPARGAPTAAPQQRVSIKLRPVIARQKQSTTHRNGAARAGLAGPRTQQQPAKKQQQQQLQKQRR